jgi:hypothetical protein
MDGAPDGAYVARVIALEDGDQYAIDDEPDTVDGTATHDQTYTATAWVRAANGTEDKPICLAIRQLDGATVVARVTAGDTWQRLQVSYTATADGASLSLKVFRWSDDVRSGESFLVDAIALHTTDGPPDAPVEEDRCEA